MLDDARERPTATVSGRRTIRAALLPPVAMASLLGGLGGAGAPVAVLPSPAHLAALHGPFMVPTQKLVSERGQPLPS
jgi:hypothetical protein